MTRRMLAAQSVATLVAAQAGRAKPILVFDVNETLLDIRVLEPHFERAFGSAQVMREWFSTLLLYSMTMTLTNAYAPFGDVAGAALDMTANARKLKVSPADRTAILSTITKVPAHPEVKDSLATLQKAGFRMVTLTNSAPAALEAQMKNSGLRPFFKQTFSVDAVKKFKPAADPYLHVAKSLNVKTNQLCLIAAHGWDIAGAMAVGCQAAFIARPGKVLFPLAPAPAFQGEDLASIAKQLMAAYG